MTHEEQMHRLQEIRGRKLSAAQTLEQEMLVVIERWVESMGYVKLAPGCHCPTCTCNYPAKTP